MKKCLLDTDIFSEVLKQKHPGINVSAQRYRQQFGNYTTSTITIFEIVKGFHKAQREEALQNFLTQMEYVELMNLTKKNAELAGRIYADLERTGQVIGVADSMIAAIAIEEGLVLATGNERHHRRVQELGYDLIIENWRNPDESV